MGLAEVLMIVVVLLSCSILFLLQEMGFRKRTIMDYSEFIKEQRRLHEQEATND